MPVVSIVKGDLLGNAICFLSSNERTDVETSTVDGFTVGTFNVLFYHSIVQAKMTV